MEQNIIVEDGKEFLEKDGGRFEIKSKCNICGEVNKVIDAMGIEADIDCLCKRKEKAVTLQKNISRYSAKIVVPSENFDTFVRVCKYDDIFLEMGKNFLDNFEKVLEKGKSRKANGIIFSGGSGTGKTFMANCICNEMNKKGYTYLDITLSSYLNLLRPPVKIEEEDLLEIIRTVNLLLIDDAGAEVINKDRGWAEEKLYRLFAVRESGMKEFGYPTILTTNLEKKQLFEHLDMYGTKRISSRINGIFKQGARHNGNDRRDTGELDF